MDRSSFTICLLNFILFCSYRYFPNQQTGVSGFGSAPTPRRQPDAPDNERNRGHNIFGGRGHVLGDH